MTKYHPIGVNKDGKRMASGPRKLMQSKRGMKESPKMMAPEPYERMGKKTRSG
jgi:hypothetical protein